MDLSRTTVLSASRRTDIPAFYMDWFMQGIRKGRFDVVNPYNRRVFRVPATVDRVHTIVFWSKNYAPFLEGGFGAALLQKGYRLAFHFTLNSDSPILEPNVPPLSERIEQMTSLCRQYEPRAVIWRFDPVCHYRVGGSDPRDNLTDFVTIAAAASRAGIKRCITSFMDPYRKIEQRVRRLEHFAWVDPGTDQKRAILREMRGVLAPLGIRLETCCEKSVLTGLQGETGIVNAACISHQHLMDLYGGDLSGKRDRGQRMEKGCGCDVSADIGSYPLHPCYHNCLFCYANPRPHSNDT